MANENGVFDFSAPGKSCMIAGGVNIGAETLPVDTERVEDCLYAKIIARKDAVIASDQRNVLTWIHGGTFNFNSVDATYENPDNLVAEHDLIVAKINYRLGQLIYFTFDLEILSWKQNLGVVIWENSPKWMRKIYSTVLSVHYNHCFGSK